MATRALLDELEADDGALGGPIETGNAGIRHDGFTGIETPGEAHTDDVTDLDGRRNEDRKTIGTDVTALDVATVQLDRFVVLESWTGAAVRALRENHSSEVL